MTHLIYPFFLNHIFSKDIFPSSCKIAIITPIYKVGEKNKTNNCRRISALTCFSGIIEKLICTSLIKFFEKA